MPDFMVILSKKLQKMWHFGDLTLKSLYFRVETANHTQLVFGGSSLKLLLANSMKCNQKCMISG